MTLSPETRPVEAMPDEFDPFAGIPDAEGRKFTQEELDKAHAQKLRRDQAGKPKAVKQSDLESKTRELMRELGYVYGRTETIGFSGVKKDLFGFVDGIAIGIDDVLFVQTTSRNNRASRLRKMATGTFKIGNGKETPCFEASARIIANPSCRLVLVLWDQPDGFGTRWRHVLEDVSLGDLEACRARSRGAV